MFNVKLSTCGGSPAIEIGISHISWEKANLLVGYGNDFFRETEIIDDETGEVVYSRYVGEDYFSPECTLAQFNSIMGEVLKYDD